MERRFGESFRNRNEERVFNIPFGRGFGRYGLRFNKDSSMNRKMFCYRDFSQKEFLMFYKRLLELCLAEINEELIRFNEN